MVLAGRSVLSLPNQLVSQETERASDTMEGSVAKTSYFSKNPFLSGTDNGRVCVIGDNSCRDGDGRRAGNSERISGEFNDPAQIRDKG